MLLKPLTPSDSVEWAQLLATCFDRSHEHMLQLLEWLHQLFDPVAWGLWDEDSLVAQYACLLRPIVGPDKNLLAGMSVNMAVHPGYRGQGLVKTVARPVYDQVRDSGGVLGLGFSNAMGVEVDRHSKSYGYRVIGQLRPTFYLLSSASAQTLLVQDTFPQLPFAPEINLSSRWRLAKTPGDFAVRYGKHPFRSYRYALWIEDDCVLGIVIFREVEMLNVPGVALIDLYGVDVYELLVRWKQTVKAAGARFVQVLSTPHSTVREAINALAFSPPLARSPCFFTLKPLIEELPTEMFCLENWDLLGGDVL